MLVVKCACGCDQVYYAYFKRQFRENSKPMIIDGEFFGWLPYYSVLE